MSLDKQTAADETWREKSEQSSSLIGVIVLLGLIALPLLLL